MDITSTRHIFYCTGTIYNNALYYAHKLSISTPLESLKSRDLKKIFNCKPFGKQPIHNNSENKKYRNYSNYYVGTI